MKMINKLFLLISLSIALFACNKDSADNPAGNNGATSFKVDGIDMTVDSAHAVLYTLGVAPFNRMIDVFAYRGGTEVLEFHFKPVAGTYTADGTFSNAWLTFKTGINYPSDYYNSTSGTLNITLCDTVARKITGTFNFTGNNGTTNKSIENGAMNVNITQVQ